MIDEIVEVSATDFVNVESFMKMMKEDEQQARDCLAHLIETDQKKLAFELWTGALENLQCRKIALGWQTVPGASALIASIFKP